MWKEPTLAALGLAVLAGIAWVFTTALCDAGGPSEALRYRPEAREKVAREAEARAREAARAARPVLKAALEEIGDHIQKELEDENSELWKLILRERCKEAEEEADQTGMASAPSERP
jgi:hypothetical protein